MALKADRNIDAWELRYFLNETQERGVVLVVNTAGSGIAMDSPDSVATVAASSSGAKPIGVLIEDFVDIDQTRFPINWHKNEQQVGHKASIARKGWVVTNKVVSATAGHDAVLASSGYVMNKPVSGWDSVVNPFVGRFHTSLDQNGFAALGVDL